MDASALVKRYVEEQESGAVRALLKHGLLATSRATELEVASALARRCREGAFPVAERDRMLAALRHDIASMYVVELTGEVVRRGIALLSHQPAPDSELRLRAADALQLASCLELGERLGVMPCFVCCDERLVATARHAGLATAP
ncbi:MAG TPA: type II toxin-antitoxin system VapC family toxin [Thermoanaerobaculia bacterium]|nr:type II toxin-antitoxin system VapC family toxin [Thermoanaerobaculia bacterium]